MIRKWWQRFRYGAAVGDNVWIEDMQKLDDGTIQLMLNHCVVKAIYYRAGEVSFLLEDVNRRVSKYETIRRIDL